MGKRSSRLIESGAAATGGLTAGTPGFHNYMARANTIITTGAFRIIFSHVDRKAPPA